MKCGIHTSRRSDMSSTADTNPEQRMLGKLLLTKLLKICSGNADHHLCCFEPFIPTCPPKVISAARALIVDPGSWPWRYPEEFWARQSVPLRFRPLPRPHHRASREARPESQAA